MAAIPIPPPPSLLARHRILAPTAGQLGECDKETSFGILDYFYSQGGNFIDTAVNYQDGDSKTWLGEWMEKRRLRDDMVVATKYTGNHTAHLGNQMIHSNTGGTRSLERLRTSYIDLYYVHLWDSTTSIPEVMNALNDLVRSRKVLYLGISDTPAWLVVKMNCYARQHGLTQFSVYQGRWSAAERDFERDIIPMCQDEGMSLAPWGVIGSGYFKSKEQRAKGGGRDFAAIITGKEAQVSDVLERVAAKKNTLITSVAMAYVMHKAPYTFPIVGGRKIEHLKGNIEALGLKLSEDDIREIEGAYKFELGFPNNMWNPQNKMILGPEDNAFNARHGMFDYVVKPGPIKPHEGPLDKPFKDLSAPSVKTDI
ncbi:aryl-alcohol dehydrogenase [Massariosphaeria phaeospora]|uniref:Aryl-alcohol dehydrogenase n=1 Tax=Massariosphaeria phaeospora TaxID=100035 RepID=A0A7C8MRM4_9PLEO|nr:aryl-alcohol dehydrogenase [Massariosphaeria phaeospora]